MRISDWSSDVCSSDLFVLTLIDRETGIEPEPAGDEIVDEGRPFRIAGLLVDDGEVGIAAVARRTRPHRSQRGQCNSRQQRLAHSPAPDSSRRSFCHLAPQCASQRPACLCNTNHTAYTESLICTPLPPPP